MELEVPSLIERAQAGIEKDAKAIQKSCDKLVDAWFAKGAQKKRKEQGWEEYLKELSYLLRDVTAVQAGVIEKLREAAEADEDYKEEREEFEE